MRTANPHIPDDLVLVTDLSSYAQPFLSEELPISKIRCCAAQCENDDFSKIELRSCAVENCTFWRCDFEDAAFIDVRFLTCDFSNSRFSGAYFERCEFIDCKCLGVNARATVIKNTALRQSGFQYALFDKTQMTDVSCDRVDFSEASFTEAKLKRFTSAGSRFIKNNFLKTMLSGLDFTDDEFAAPTVSTPPLELKGAVLSLLQAAELATLWGIVVKR